METATQLLLPGFDYEEFVPPKFLWWCYNSLCFYQQNLLDEYEVLWKHGHACCPACHQPCKRGK